MSLLEPAYQVELVWNREFDFVPYGPIHANLYAAVQAAKEIENSGDGARVKKTRVINADTGRIVWAYGKRTSTEEHS